MIKAVNLGKSIGHKQILRGISLEIATGEFLCILGPNGAGKTTLLKLLAQLTAPTNGQVIYDEGDHNQAVAGLRQNIGLISHNTFLYPNLTAWENLKFYGLLYGVPDLEARIQAVITEVGLDYVLSDPVRTFSRGMQQRLAIARAIIHDPSILFLDEPYTGLDQHAIEILNQVLLGLKRKDRTIVLITHNFEQGVSLSDRVVIIARGKIVFTAATASLTGEDFKTVYLRHVEGA